MSGKEAKGKKRSKSYYRKCAYGAKQARQGAYTLEPGIKGFLVMCNNNESGAVRESYNILNEYADSLYGSEQASSSHLVDNCSEEEDDDVEKALKKEVEEIKSSADFKQKRFQNVKTKAKNCIFIQSTVEDPVTLVLKIMEDIAQNGLKKARYAARILPILGTCKAHTDEIEKLAKTVLLPVFSPTSSNVPSSYTILYKTRNNNGNDCGKNQVVQAIRTTISQLNHQINFSWTHFQVAIVVEVVCTICCLGVAPEYARLRKYNLQELQQGPKVLNSDTGSSIRDVKSEPQGLEVLNSDNGSSIQDVKSEVLNSENGSSIEDIKSEPQGLEVLNSDNGNSIQNDKPREND